LISFHNSPAAVNADDLAWESAYRDSKWFTRGWTLQELPALSGILLSKWQATTSVFDRACKTPEIIEGVCHSRDAGDTASCYLVIYFRSKMIRAYFFRRAVVEEMWKHFLTLFG
jgi:hypothetical protein